MVIPLLEPEGKLHEITLLNPSRPPFAKGRAHSPLFPTGLEDVLQKP
jgi:hypothetical protein